MRYALQLSFVQMRKTKSTDKFAMSKWDDQDPDLSMSDFKALKSFLFA